MKSEKHGLIVNSQWLIISNLMIKKMNIVSSFKLLKC